MGESRRRFTRPSWSAACAAGQQQQHPPESCISIRIFLSASRFSTRLTCVRGHGLEGQAVGAQLHAGVDTAISRLPRRLWWDPAAAAVPHLQRHNVLDLVALQALEDDELVDTVDELGTEVHAHLGCVG